MRTDPIDQYVLAGGRKVWRFVKRLTLVEYFIIVVALHPVRAYLWILPAIIVLRILYILIRTQIKIRRHGKVPIAKCKMRL